MNILIFSPSNLRAVDQQSQALLFKKMGHNPSLLTCLPEGLLHKHFQTHGFKAYSSNIKSAGILYFIKQIIFLVKFCRKNNIGLVCSHLQNCALIAGFAKYFMKAKVVYMRHHTDYVGIYNSPKEKLQNYFANTLSPKIIAISDEVKKQLLQEGVTAKKIVRINLCYNFDEYNADQTDKFDEVKNDITAGLTVLYAARLDPVKRHTLAFEVVENLLIENVDCKLICIGKGEIENELKRHVADKNLNANIIFKGFVTNVFDYIKASDILLLLSDTEASSHMLKEAGICGKTLIVCKQVGDFEDFIVDGENGFLVNKADPVKETVDILKKIHADKSWIDKMGQNLKKTVFQHFSINSNFAELYQQLFNEINLNK